MRRTLVTVVTCVGLAAAAACDLFTGPVRTGEIEVVSSRRQAAPPDSPAASPAAPTAIESARMTVTSGTTSRNATSSTQAGGFIEVSIDGLEPGLYGVEVEGLTGTEVTWFGSTADVPVTSGRRTTAEITNLATFVPVLAAPATPTTSFTILAQYSKVPLAGGYIVESDRAIGFPNPVRRTVTDTSAPVTVTDTGTTYVRVRATNARVTTAAFSAVQSVRVTKEPADTTDAAVNAAALGFAPTITLPGFNIAPAGDLDWFAVSLCDQDSLIVQARAVRLAAPSPLNTFLQLFDSTGTGTAVAANDNADSTDAEIRMKMGAHGTYRLRVSAAPGAASAATMGHYELVVTSKKGPRNEGSSCRTTGGPGPPLLPAAGVRNTTR